MLIKKIYKDRLDILKSEYTNFNEYSDFNLNIVSDYVDKINNVLDDIKILSSDTNMSSQIKYIKIEEKTKCFETLSKELDILYKDIYNKKHSLDNELHKLSEYISSDNNSLVDDVKEYLYKNIIYK